MFGKTFVYPFNNSFLSIFRCRTRGVVYASTSDCDDYTLVICFTETLGLDRFPQLRAHELIIEIKSRAVIILNLVEVCICNFLPKVSL